MRVEHWIVLGVTAVFLCLLMLISSVFMPGRRAQRALDRALIGMTAICLARLLAPRLGVNALTLTVSATFGAPGVALLSLLVI